MMNFDRQYNQALAGTQAGGMLASASLRNMEERSLYNQSQPLIDEVYRAMIEREKRLGTQTDALQRANVNLMTGTE